jgi:hypothetical protein
LSACPEIAELVPGRSRWLPPPPGTVPPWDHDDEVIPTAFSMAIGLGRLRTARLMEPWDIEPVMRQALAVGRPGREAVLATIGARCRRCRRRAFRLQPKQQKGVDLRLRCLPCAAILAGELKGRRTKFNCYRAGLRSHPFGYCQLLPSPGVEPGGIIIAVDPLYDAVPSPDGPCYGHAGWTVVGLGDVAEALADVGVRLGPGPGDFPVAASRVFAAAALRFDILDRLAGRPGRLDGPEIEPMDVARAAANYAFRNAGSLGRIADGLEAAGMEATVLKRSYGLRLWLDGRTSVGVCKGYGPLGEPITYTADYVRSSDPWEWDVEGGSKASGRLVVDGGLRVAGWAGAQAAAEDESGFAERLILDNLQRVQVDR